jgi:hypothetical protein
MWGIIGEALGFVRETVSRRFKARREREHTVRSKEIKQALANRSPNAIADLFNRMRRKGNSSKGG